MTVSAADKVTTWGRPFNNWKDGAIGMYWNVSLDCRRLRVTLNVEPSAWTPPRLPFLTSLQYQAFRFRQPIPNTRSSFGD